MQSTAVQQLLIRKRTRVDAVMMYALPQLADYEFTTEMCITCRMA